MKAVGLLLEIVDDRAARKEQFNDEARRLVQGQALRDALVRRAMLVSIPAQPADLKKRAEKNAGLGIGGGVSADTLDHAGAEGPMGGPMLTCDNTSTATSKQCSLTTYVGFASVSQIISKNALVAATYDISRNHLTKVAYELIVAGYVVGVRGRGGGIRLAKPVEAIILGEVVRATEAEMTLLQCIRTGDTSCALIPACVLRRAVILASAAFLKVLVDYTLGDLLPQGAKVFQVPCLT